MSDVLVYNQSKPSVFILWGLLCPVLRSISLALQQYSSGLVICRDNDLGFWFHSMDLSVFRV